MTDVLLWCLNICLATILLSMAIVMAAATALALRDMATLFPRKANIHHARKRGE